MRRNEQNIKEIFDQSFPAPEEEETESTCERVLHRLNSAGVDDSLAELAAHPDVMRPARPWWSVVAWALLLTPASAYAQAQPAPDAAAEATPAPAPVAATIAATLGQVSTVTTIQGPAAANNLFRLPQINPMPANVLDVPGVPAEVHTVYPENPLYGVRNLTGNNQIG